jgi:palmitoyltransferase
MGYSFSEWIFPIRPSPCASHSSRVSLFKMNKELIRSLKAEAGLAEVRHHRSSSGRSARRDRGSRSASGSGSGGGAEDYGSRRKKRRRRRKQSEGEGEKGLR